MSTIFERASKQQLRFQSTKGNLTTEDLWELSLQSLDSLARGVNKALKEANEESFISTKTKSNTELELKLDILKHIIADKIADQEAKKAKAERAQELDMLQSLLAKNKTKELKSLSSEEILKRIADLQE